MPSSLNNENSAKETLKSLDIFSCFSSLKPNESIYSQNIHVEIKFILVAFLLKYEFYVFVTTVIR